MPHKPKSTPDYRAFCAKWRKKGVVAFTEEYLGYQLSSDEKKFLNYLQHGKNPFVELVAPRNSGKTLCLGFYTTWLLVTQGDIIISCMGGSLKQSTKLMRYIKKWRFEHSELEDILYHMRENIAEKSIETIYGGRCEFLTCTEKSASGEHGFVLLDEASKAERTLSGRRAIESILGQILEKKTKLVITSTCDCILGMFYKIVQKPKKYGFKLFQWDILRHISGESPRKHFTDKNPENWFIKEDCPWISLEKIRKLRQLKSDNWFMINLLGGLTVGSGNIFDQKDLDNSILPFDIKKLKFSEIRMGLDLGFSAKYDPTFLVVVGFAEGRAWCLYAEQKQTPKITNALDEWIIPIAKQYQCWEIYVDPSASSKPIVALLEGKGFVCPSIRDLEPTKEARIQNVVSLSEKKRLRIHSEYCEPLIRSLRSVYYDAETGKVAKVNDHGLDALCYALVTVPLDLSVELKPSDIVIKEAEEEERRWDQLMKEEQWWTLKKRRVDIFKEREEDV